MNQWCFLTAELKAAIRKTTFLITAAAPIITVIFFNIHCLGAVLMNLMAKLFFLLPAQPFLLRYPKKAAIDAQTNCIQKALALHTRMISGGHLQPYEGGEFLYGFLCGLLRHVLHPAAFHTESTASQAALLMEKEFATIGGIDEVAKRLHISSEHLSRSFHSEWGIAPVQYLNRMRIQSAMNDLLGSTDTIEVIAVKNGFANGNYFAKVFRRYTKMTPGEYRCKKAGQIRTLSV